MSYDFKAASNAAKLGQTFADANRSSKAASVVRDIAKAVMGVGDADPVSQDVSKPKSSLLGKIDLKSMLSMKSKAPAKVD